MSHILLISIFLLSELAYGLSFFEPNIECTVIKVHSTTRISGHTKFPKLYESINNDPAQSNLFIAGKKIAGVKPKTTIKTDNFERISINIETKNLELELKGKPISRNGTLKLDGRLLADITCH